jgi:hypothetical protein
VIGFSEGRFLIHSTPFAVVAMPPAFWKNQRSAHRQSKQVVPFLVKTKGLLKYTYYFGRRFIPFGCVAKSRGIQIFLRFYALMAERLNAQNDQFIFLQA